MMPTAAWSLTLAISLSLLSHKQRCLCGASQQPPFPILLQMLCHPHSFSATTLRSFLSVCHVCLVTCDAQRDVMAMLVACMARLKLCRAANSFASTCATALLSSPRQWICSTCCCSTAMFCVCRERTSQGIDVVSMKCDCDFGGGGGSKM